MKILVTGGTGFLGTHLVDTLCASGEPSRVRVLAQSPAPRLASRGVEVLRGSVLVPEDLRRALAGVDAVYHLAGMVSRKPEEGHRMYAVHVEGTRLLCEAARAAGCKRLLVASTSGTIAVSDREGAGLDESSPAPIETIARWPYYASKYYQEEAARKACGDDLHLVIVNPALLLGPGDDRLSSTREILTFLSGDVQMIPRGALNFVDARDVAAILPSALEKGRSGERYLLGGANWSFKEFFGRLERLSKRSGPRLTAPPRKLSILAARAQEALYEAVGKRPPVDAVSVEMSTYFWTFASTKAEKAFGWKPREATETLYDTIKYVREHVLGERGVA